ALALGGQALEVVERHVRIRSRGQRREQARQRGGEQLRLARGGRQRVQVAQRGRGVREPERLELPQRRAIIGRGGQQVFRSAARSVGGHSLTSLSSIQCGGPEMAPALPKSADNPRGSVGGQAARPSGHHTLGGTSGQIASSPFSPVRMRMASPIESTKTLPSPIEPVLADWQMTETTLSTRLSGTTTSTFTLGRKSIVYSEPR